jgi:phosphate acetyltransferase/phosphate butyryltransferase
MDRLPTSTLAVSRSVYPRLEALTACVKSDVPFAVVHPGDAASMLAAAEVAARGLARPVLVGPRDLLQRAAETAAVVLDDFEVVDSGAGGGSGAYAGKSAARRAAELARDGAVAGLIKGSLHTEELMSAVLSREADLRTASRVSHAFVFDLPRFHKLLAVADCVVNVTPTLPEKRDILENSVGLLHSLGIRRPKVAIVAAVETVSPTMPATLDAAALVQMSLRGQLPTALVDGPFGFDNAISAESARSKGINSDVAGDPDLLLVPDLQCGNMLYKSFNYIGGGECGGIVLGAKVPVALNSRADSLHTRLASAALAVRVALGAQATTT